MGANSRWLGEDDRPVALSQRPIVSSYSAPPLRLAVAWTILALGFAAGSLFTVICWLVVR